MSIEALSIKNFKGVAEETAFTLAPLTLFIGPNSSGKSTCIHALGALSQTVKIGDISRAIVLDDEYAQIHLGRFIEIIHSKSYNESFEIGFEITEKSAQIRRAIGMEKGESKLTVTYSFKSSKRTQEIYIEKAIYKFGSRIIEISRQKMYVYSVFDSLSNMTYPAIFTGNFQFELDWPDEHNITDDWQKCSQAIRLIHRSVSNELRNTTYLGPFRQSPMRRYPYKGAAPHEVGASGEAAISLLANEYIATTKRLHHKQISSWLEILGLAKKIKVTRVGASDLFDLTITLPDDNALPIADLGYGLSQILPVLIQCSFARSGSTLLFEQPELHLHPGAARKLARVFTEVISEKKVHILAETHSPELFHEIFNEIREGRIAPEDVIAYDVKREGGRSTYKRIDIVNDEGHIEPSHPWGKDLA